MMKKYQYSFGVFLVILMVVLVPKIIILAKADSEVHYSEKTEYESEEELDMKEAAGGMIARNLKDPDDVKRCKHDDDSKITKIYYQEKVKATSSDYCYQYVEVTKYTCKDCGESWENRQCQYTVPHSCREVIDHYDDSYIWYYKVCQNSGCGYRIYSRKEPHNGHIPVTPINSLRPIVRENAID